MERAADWTPPIIPVPQKPKVAQFYSAVDNKTQWAQPLELHDGSAPASIAHAAE
jgi:hypothetical protein